MKNQVQSYRRGVIRLLLLVLVLACSGCTIHHSKQALWTADNVPAGPQARFVTEEDSGLSLLGFIMLSEPDHYAVLMERLRKRYKCSKLHHAQLDFFTDHWLLVAFPIARVTVVCEGEPQGKVN